MDAQRYGKIVATYRALVGHGLSLSSTFSEKRSDDERLAYADSILGKMLAHAVSLGVLSPAPGAEGPELWDLSSTSAIARCIIEAFDALSYIALDAVSDEERHFRVLLWELHDQVRRKRMLSNIGSVRPELAGIEARASDLLVQVREHPFYSKVGGNARSKIENDDAPAYHLSQRERCAASTVNYDYYNTATMHLSQFVHTAPFSLHQLRHFRAGEEDSLRLMSLPLQYSLAFLSKALLGASSLVPGELPEAHPDLRYEMEMQARIVEKGLKNAG